MSTAITDVVDQLGQDVLVAAVAEVFTEQIAAWRAAGRPGVPLLVLAGALPPARGRCISCGIPTPGWRCTECLRAVELALESAAGGDVSFTPGSPSTAPFLAEVEDNVRDRDFWRTSDD